MLGHRTGRKSAADPGDTQATAAHHSSCADNAACEGFFGMLKRERVYRRSDRSHAEARADIFDYIEQFYNPNRRRRMATLEAADEPLTQLSVDMR